MRIKIASLAVIVLPALLAGCASPGAPHVTSDNDYGVLVMAHGGPRHWNESVLSAAGSLKDKYRVEGAFGMADAASIQEGVRKLEAQGARRIGVVRLFVSGESWYQRTEQILGLASGAPPRPAGAHSDGHGGHGMEFWRVDSGASFALSREGLAESPRMDAVLVERARTLSRDAAREDVLILAHGPADDAENRRWIEYLEARAGAVRAALPFRRVAVQTLREDWPDSRKAAEARIREFVNQASEGGGTAIVVPFRVQGFGPYARVLEGLQYRSDGAGLLPHPNVVEWIDEKAGALRDGPFRSPAGT